MQSIQSANDELMKLDAGDLRALMLASSEAHALMCSVASEELDPHAFREVMESRVAAMSKEELARALAPFAALGAVVHQGHAGHAHSAEHGHS
ncbi:MAG: hypothetical protein M0R74_01995 [Dehalococcoidia bacterium]|nr:hypothetical protein [Dehalococcoidia bacterium]